MKITGLLLFLMFTFTACGSLALAQETSPQRDKFAELPDYVIEVRRPEGCVVSPISPKHKSGIVLYALPRPAKVQPNTSARPITSKVFVTANQQAEQWEIKVSVGTGEFYDAGDTVVGEFKLKLNERANVNEVSRFGLAPIRVGVVKIVRQQAESPTFTSRSQSVSVESIEADASPDPYHITLKNNSGSDLVAIQYNTFRGPQFLELKWLSQGLINPLIKAGATYRLSVGSEDKSCGNDEGYRPNQSDRIELVSAVFADGSYEGQTGLPALIKGTALGNRKNLERVVEALRNGNSNSEEFIAQLNQLHAELNEETESYMIEIVRSMLPSLSADTTPAVTGFIRSGMHDVKVNLSRDVRHLEDLKRANDPRFIKQWFEQAKTKYESWLAAAENMTSH